MLKLAYCILHYGKPYFREAVQAIYPQVDRIIILYTSSPSQGFGTQLPCPDTEDELKSLIAPFKDKIEWVNGTWNNEGEHNDAIRSFQDGYDWIIRFDSDEIYQPGSVDRMIALAAKQDAKIYRVPFLHFWRSFNKVCRDAQMPDRIIRVNGGNLPFAYIDSQNETNSVIHLGYAQPTEYIVYKMTVQGHHAEWRQDWFDTKWTPDAQTDLHPVVFDFWNTEEFNKNKLPKVLRKHPNFQKEIIE